MFWTFDDDYIGQMGTDNSLKTKDIPRPYNMERNDWHNFASKICGVLNGEIVNNPPKTNRKAQTLEEFVRGDN